MLTALGGMRGLMVIERAVGPFVRGLIGSQRIFDHVEGYSPGRQA